MYPTMSDALVRYREITGSSPGPETAGDEPRAGRHRRAIGNVAP